MTVSGDLTTIDLADLLQNIEAHSRTGTLTLRSDEGDAHLFFRGGKVVLLARHNRPELVDALVAAGHVSPRRLEAARKKQKGTRRGVAEHLVGARSFTMDQLKELAEQRLSEDVADLIADAHGEFHFSEGDKPGDDFDPDEAALELALAVAPLVLEATRRVDHWAEIRKFVPTEAMHFRARDGAKAPSEGEDQQTAAELLQALDGSRSVLEVIGLFPGRRFTAFKLLAEFVRDRIARPVTGDDMLEVAIAAEATDAARARVLVRRALDTEPHHAGLLAAEARFAEALEDAAGAASVHKLLAHLHLEAGRSAEALAALTEGKRLTPADPAVWERSLQLALAQGRRQDGLHDGMRLVELYRGPGLHSRAKAVIDRLLCVEPDAVDLHIEFARTCVDCGESAEAVKHLSRRGKALVGAGNYVAARTLYAEILAIDANYNEAAVSIEMIDKEEFSRRRERRRRLMRGVMLFAATSVVGTFVCCEALARMACAEVEALISRERMIEDRQYAEAIELWTRVRDDHPLAVTAWLEVPRTIADLRGRLDQTGHK